VEVLGERAGQAVGDAGREPGLAQVGTALQAAGAAAAGDQRQSGDAVTLGDALDLAAHLDDLAGELVAHDLARLDPRAVGVAVEVRAADPARADSEDDPIGARLGIGDVFDDDVLVPAEHSRSHGASTSLLATMPFRRALHALYPTGLGANTASGTISALRGGVAGARLMIIR
jgi:hypothetical protein